MLLLLELTMPKPKLVFKNAGHTRSGKILFKENKVTTVYCSTIRRYHAVIKKPFYYILQVQVVPMHNKISAVDCSTVRDYHALKQKPCNYMVQV